MTDMMPLTLPDGSTTDEQVVARFLNSMGSWQVVTDGPDATCPTCGYPERHRIYDVRTSTETLITDGCPSCETSRLPAHTIGPDCRDGKCLACDGRAWDPAAEDVTACGCSCHKPEAA